LKEWWQQRGDKQSWGSSGGRKMETHEGGSSMKTKVKDKAKKWRQRIE